MNPNLLRRPWSLTRIASLLAFFLAATWTLSFVAIVKLVQLERLGLDGNLSQSGLVKRMIRDAVSNQRQGSTADSNSSNVHIVFSTDCSGYQHWQSLVSYYSFRRAGHLGPVTRIVSGCNPSEEEAIRTEFNKIQKKNKQLRLHFTPSFAIGGKRYKYSNKPGGLYHWIQNRTTATPQESVIALVDPDMMPLRPIVSQLGEGTTATFVARDSVEHRDEHGRAMLLRQKHLPKLPSHVTTGVAAGQHFGLGGFWASAGTKNARPGFREFNVTKICGAESPCSNRTYTTRDLADKSYAVGPVYIASTSDWIEILPRWHDFTPQVHSQYPKLLAEMYAFTMAAADLKLKFALSSSYMVSDPKTMSTTEGWLWIDEYANRAQPSTTHHTSGGNVLRNVCEGAASASLPTETLQRLENYGYGNYFYGSSGFPSADRRGGLPTLLHYCQKYNFANHSFAKRKMRHDFFRCDGEPLKFDVEVLLKELDSLESNGGLSETQKKKEMRAGFMICHLIPLMNLALIDYKSDTCGTILEDVT